MDYLMQLYFTLNNFTLHMRICTLTTTFRLLFHCHYIFHLSCLQLYKACQYHTLKNNRHFVMFQPPKFTFGVECQFSIKCKVCNDIQTIKFWSHMTDLNIQKLRNASETNAISIVVTIRFRRSRESSLLLPIMQFFLYPVRENF